MGDRNVNNTYPHEGFSFERLVPQLISNSSETAVFFRAIPPELYYNEPSDQKPSDDIRSKMNVTGLTPEEIRTVMAFPVFDRNNV